MLRIDTQCRLALQALNALVPIANEAGIATRPECSYDEWETLVQAVFEAFITIPISDETGLYSPDQFLSLGFDPTLGKKIVAFTFKNDRYFLFDFCVGHDGKMVCEARPLAANTKCDSIFMSFEECSNFSIATL